MTESGGEQPSAELPSAELPSAELPGAPNSTPSASDEPGAVAKPTGPSKDARLRWLIAGGVAIAVVAIAGGAYLLLSSRPIPEALRYIPADSVVVAELRMDLPGDQMQHVGNLLAHFPGFKDQSNLTAKIDEAIGRIVSTASSGQVDYATRVKPWIGGPAFAAARPATSGSGTPGWLVVGTTDGTTACPTVLGTTSTKTEAHGALNITETADGTVACMLDGRFGLLGDPGSVGAGLDAHAGHTGIDGVAAYQAARDTLGGDRLATVYVNASAYGRLAGQAAPFGSEVPLPSVLPHALASLPEWVMAGVRAEDDALVVDLVSAPVPASSAPPASGSPLPTLPPPHASSLATLVPGNALALIEVHGVGPAIDRALAGLHSDPQLADQLKQIDAALALAGGPDQLVGWIDDLGVVLVPGGGAPGSLSIDGGLVLLASDEATASAKAAQIKGVLTLASLGSGGSAQDTTVDGTMITTADLGDLSSLAAATGLGTQIPAGTDIKVSVAARGKLVIIGGGESFARTILEVTAGTSLADESAYQHALGRGLQVHVAQIFVGAASVLSLADAAIPADQRERWTTDIKPYLDPFDAVLVTISTENGASRSRIVATVK